MSKPEVVDRFTLDDPEWDVLESELPPELEKELQGVDPEWRPQIVSTS